MIVFIDIDDTICKLKTPGEYSTATPIACAIEKANKMYDEGHEIVYWTARGSVTGLDWRELTERQFLEWGVKYHELRFGKPFYDIFIDDKNINSLDWLKS
jgi:CMP-N,N'-diacetyllegionaminic acid synthase